VAGEFPNDAEQEMTHSHHEFRRTVAASAVLLLVVYFALGRPAVASAQAVWELTPYQFHVYLAAAPAPELPPRVVEEMAVDLVDRVDATVGAAWNMTVSIPPVPLRQAMLVDLASVDVKTIPPEALENDKVTLVTISLDLNGFRIAARELDVQTRTFSAMVERSVPQPALLSQTLFTAVVDAFAPLASIKTSEGNQVELRLRAGRFTSGAPEILAVPPGTIFRPIIRYDDRQGKPKRILSLPWSYLAVQEVDQARLTCQLYSGLRSAFAGRRRGAVHQLALAVKPPVKPTRLTIHGRTGPKRPLGGYDVFLQKPGEKQSEWLGRTDLKGSILVPPTPHLLHIIYVRNGGQLLAKLPLVPGLEDAVRAAVIDDDQRLAAESVIMAAQEELVDLVTRRAVLAARISAAIKAGKPEEADVLFVQLYGLRTRDQFTQQLALEREKLYSEDPLIERRVDLMFDKTRKLVVQYLDPDEIDRIGDEVRAAKEAAQSEDNG
jgi:hypothetical protein